MYTSVHNPWIKSHTSSRNMSKLSLRSKKNRRSPKYPEIFLSNIKFLCIAIGSLTTIVIFLLNDEYQTRHQLAQVNNNLVDPSKNKLETSALLYLLESNEESPGFEEAINKETYQYAKNNQKHTSKYFERTRDFNATVDKIIPPSLKKKRLDPKNLQIALIGERHSGTNWITSELERCFPSLDFKAKLVRYKHWFQDKELSNRKKRKPTIVVAQFRNIYDWISAMKEGPHHAPLHLRLDWKEFVSKPWTMPRPNRDLEILDKKGVICQDDFQYNRIISCIRGRKVSLPDPRFKIKSMTNYSGHNPQYELMQNGTGQPYPSIINLRSDKIRNFMGITEWEWVKAFIPVQYESLITFGTKGLIDQIQNLTKVTPNCDPSHPRAWKSKTNDKRLELWLNENADWEAESMIGYSKRKF